MARRDTYWAAAGADELPDLVREKFDEYTEVCKQTGRLELWRKIYRTIYGMDKHGRHASAFVQRDGEQGELVSIKVGHTRNLSNHIVNLMCENRVSFDCRARETDSEATTQTTTGQQWLDMKVRDKGVGKSLRKAAKIATEFLESFILVDWDFSAGDEHMIDPETGRPIHKGDVSVGVYYPDDVAREFFEEQDGQSPWHITRTEENVFALAAEHPEHADYILGLAERIEEQDAIVPYGLSRMQDGKSDRTVVYRLCHRPCPQLRTGRTVKIVGDLLIDDRRLIVKGQDGQPRKVPYPVRRMSPEDQGKTCFGYGSTADLLSINDLIDMLYSAAATNNNAGAVQNYWVESAENVSVTQLAGSLNLLECPKKPEVLELCHTPPETYNFIKMTETLVEMLSGVNSVARGNPDGALKGASGSALALLQSMTIQFASGLQEGYGLLCEEVAQAMIELLQIYGIYERMEDLWGKENRPAAQQISGAKVARICKVQVDLGNPATRTFAGRKQIADEMLERGMFKRPHQYLQFLATGKFEHLTESETSQLTLIKRENEDMKAGKPVIVILTDDHPLHMLEHGAELDDPEVRRDPMRVQTILAHQQEHLDVWRSAPPELLAALGRQPFPAMQMALEAGQGGNPAMAGAPTGAGGPPAGPEVPVDDANGMPQMPTNPLTGEQAPMPGAA